MSEIRFSKHSFSKKALALLISVALLSGLAACGSDEKKEKNTGKTRSTSQATRAKDAPNIIEFDDSDEEDDDGNKTKSGDYEDVTTPLQPRLQKQKRPPNKFITKKKHLKKSLMPWI